MATAGDTSEKANPLYPDVSTPALMIHVVAPAALPAGYTFDAEINEDPDRTFTVEVPEGGVNEGDTFLAPLPENVDGARLRAPTGYWKDGMFDCFSLGIIHPSAWCGLCCPQILMAQVMTRMHLNWLGEHGPVIATINTFKVVVALTVLYVVYASALNFAANQYDYENLPLINTILSILGSIIFTAWALYALCKTRRNLRERYSIEEDERFKGFEDICCSLWCTWCTISQMARHTGEYETYQGLCFTETGLPDSAPFTV